MNIVVEAVVTINVINSSCSGNSGMFEGMVTTMGVPFKTEAGILPETVSGAVNLVVTETKSPPYQYSISLALVKVGFEMLTDAETPEPMAPLLEVTLTS